MVHEKKREVKENFATLQTFTENRKINFSLSLKVNFAKKGRVDIDDTSRAEQKEKSRKLMDAIV